MAMGLQTEGNVDGNGLSTEGNLNLISAPCVRGIPLHRTWQGSCRWGDFSLNLDDVKIGVFS